MAGFINSITLLYHHPLPLLNKPLCQEPLSHSYQILEGRSLTLLPSNHEIQNILLSSILHIYICPPSIPSFSCLKINQIEKRDLFAVATELGTLGNDLKNTSTLKTFLGDKGNIITQNDVLDSNGSCATMTVLFARGTGEWVCSLLTSLGEWALKKHKLI